MSQKIKEFPISCKKLQMYATIAEVNTEKYRSPAGAGRGIPKKSG